MRDIVCSTTSLVTAGTLQRVPIFALLRAPAHACLRGNQGKRRRMENAANSVGRRAAHEKLELPTLLHDWM
jgi:hypothetical protein